MSETITASLTVSGGDTITAEINTLARGPAGPAGEGGSGAITSATTSDGTANLSISNVSTATGSVSGILTAPTAATTTSTTQVATTAFVQQELASGVAVARNLEFLAHNGSGSTIAKGSIVYINGAVGGVPRITKSQANNNTNSARTIGFVKADIADGANGFVIIEGELLNVSTADLGGIIGPGIPLYLSPTTPGAFTRTKPSAPQHLVYVGVVVTASTGVNLDGKIIVGIQNGYELNEIHDVSITAPVAAKQVIKRNAGDTLWVNEAIVSADVSDATNAATPSTLVLRNTDGGASFADLTTSGPVSLHKGGSSDLFSFDFLNVYFGPGSALEFRTKLGSGATGDALFTAATPAEARTTLGARTFTKPTDESRSSNSTYTVDTHLKNIPLEAGKSYKIDFYIPAYVPTTEGGKVRLLLPLSSRATVPNSNGGVSVTNWGNGSGGAISTTTSGAPAECDISLCKRQQDTTKAERSLELHTPMSLHHRQTCPSNGRKTPPG